MVMISRILPIISLSSLMASTFFLLPTKAQTKITGDETTNSLVNGSLSDTCISALCLITGGINVGTNRFHSLSDFSLFAGDEAQFESSGVATIFTRVTGGNISELDGLISTTDGSTDLFLLNPSGILFGPNASLNIGGSFISSTANSLVFDNGAVFDATQTRVPNALLNINVPVGLQYGAAPNSIQVQGTSNQLTLDPDIFNVDRSNRPVGLEVGSNQTLALIGGGIRLTGGNITAESGHIEVGAVGDDSLVNLTPQATGWQFQYDDVNQFQNINLSQAASLDVSGEGNGQIHVQGERLSLRGGSVLLSNTAGIDSGASISVDTARRLTIKGFSEIFFPSGIFNDVSPGATGNSGTVAIDTGLLRLTDGGLISATTFGQGNSGGGMIEAQRIFMDGTPLSFIFANTGFLSTGQGGNMVINADQIELQDGSQIITSAFGADSQGGDLTINAQSIVGSGLDPSDATGSGIFSLSILGEGGDITVRTETLHLETGATIGTGTLAIANAGDLTIEADHISLSGAPPDIPLNGAFVPSSIVATVGADAPGNGGSLTIKTSTLDLTNGSQISSSTDGLGNAGTVRINAEQMTIRGTETNQLNPSAIFAQANENSSGMGSSIFLRVEDLLIQDGAQIGVSTFGSGNAGELSIEAKEITLIGTSSGSRSGLFANALIGTGNGGDLQVTAERLIIQDGATVSASNFQSQNLLAPGQGSAGNITITSPLLYLNNEGLIVANTASGDKGNINLQNQILILSDTSRISTNASSADGGNILMDVGEIAALDNSDISANALAGLGGRVVVSADGILGTAFRPTLTAQSDITASSALGPAFSGNVIINTADVDPSRGLVELPAALSDVSDQITTACEQGDESGLVVTGAGGIAHVPHHTLQPQSIWPDMRLSQDFHYSNQGLVIQQDETNSSRLSTDTASTQLDEAQSWWVNEQGSIVLGPSEHGIRPEVLISCGLR